jgi:hypothetical protein
VFLAREIDFFDSHAITNIERVLTDNAFTRPAHLEYTCQRRPVEHTQWLPQRLEHTREHWLPDDG